MEIRDRSTLNCTRKRERAGQSQKLGLLGENLVADWLVEQGWEILQRRWRCRWGELDLVALAGQGETKFIPSDPRVQTLEPTLIFVEVKTRRGGNWDADGMLAVSPTKQAKLWQAAELFLSEHPEWVQYPCRFDVALVKYEPLNALSPASAGSLILFDYLASAFSA